MHAFDQAVALTRVAGGEYTGHTSAQYWNMVGPFGGTTAATALQAVLQHPQLLGEPVALTVNYAGATREGAFRVHARPVRTNRSTQHWTIELVQAADGGGEEVMMTATAMTALRRDTWSASDSPMPAVPPPAGVRRMPTQGGVAWLQQFELRFAHGGIPARWDGSGQDSLTRIWMRDDVPRALDFLSLAAKADLFFPRVWLRRATRVPIGTVSLTVYFHADAAQLAACGDGYLLGEVRGQEFRNGYFDHAAQLWSEAGTLLATTHQIVYYKE